MTSANRRATIVTLSQMAGVAPSTVTRALRGDTRISTKTRKRILALAQEQGYTPNVLARTLSSGKSGLYGLVLGPSTNPFYTELMHEATRQAEALGYRFLIIHAGSGPVELRTTEALLHYQVDGCLVSSATQSSRVAEVCEKNAVPLVMVNRVALQHGCAVTCDNASGGRDLARLLIGKGRKKFAIVTTSSYSSTAQERESAFTDELARSELKLKHRYDGKSHYEGGYEAGVELAKLTSSRRPDAVFALSDVMAMGLLDALRLKGVLVPDDMAVVGFDGLSTSARPIYDLTTIEQPLPMMIERAFAMLASRFQNPRLPDETVSLKGELIIRGSSGN
ncbi:sugar-binding protein [Salinicola sp. MH3R3-1]|uniref:LacI family DNA-binding transcriptional regulator n=1 Tax=Salinicola sp. MH3R3-1 TaxID=1928762 RepID=UPI00094EF47D|nr:LacI family DNA-binding transcriptional regulator [Salinicola sp. MH3R3-1]OLO09335.1 sugar-binding protein [Salinicola sp. MH3R3-1]